MLVASKVISVLLSLVIVILLPPVKVTSSLLPVLGSKRKAGLSLSPPVCTAKKSYVVLSLSVAIVKEFAALVKVTFLTYF